MLDSGGKNDGSQPAEGNEKPESGNSEQRTPDVSNATSQTRDAGVGVVDQSLQYVVQVAIPLGLVSGQTFAINYNGQQHQLVVPPGLAGGQTMAVSLPCTPGIVSTSPGQMQPVSPYQIPRQTTVSSPQIKRVRTMGLTLIITAFLNLVCGWSSILFGGLAVLFVAFVLTLIAGLKTIKIARGEEYLKYKSTTVHAFNLWIAQAVFYLAAAPLCFLEAAEPFFWLDKAELCGYVNSNIFVWKSCAPFQTFSGIAGVFALVQMVLGVIMAVWIYSILYSMKEPACCVCCDVASEGSPGDCYGCCAAECSDCILPCYRVARA